MLFLQEVKIKPGDDKTQNTVKVAVNDARRPVPGRGAPRPEPSGKAAASSQAVILADGGPEYDVFFNLPADSYNAKGFGGKVYGVASIIRRDFMGSHVKKVRGVPWDREGRVQVIENKDISFPLGKAEPSASSSRKLAIFNIYAVNGTSNVYRSTQTDAPAGTRHDRKLAFHTDLLHEACLLESQGYAVVIAGDLNVAPDERDGHPRLRTFPAQHVDTAPNRASYKPVLASLPNMDSNPMRLGMDGMDGIDTFRHVHGSERRHSYHPWGRPWGSNCDRVDLTVVSRRLKKDIVNAGFATVRATGGLVTTVLSGS